MSWHSVTMVSLGQASLVLCLLSAAVRADVDVDCGRGSVRVRWREDRSRLDPSLLLLGHCPPTSMSRGEAVFDVGLTTCSFRRQITGDELSYMNELTYESAANNPFLAFTHSVVCTYTRPHDWYPDLFEPAFHMYGSADVVFHMELMNDDFTAPASSNVFPLGSIIPIRAYVEQASHQPLLLLLEECVASSSEEMRSKDQVYLVITNHGCLMDSKTTPSMYQPRERTSELRLSLQAFKFALGEEVFIHCDLVAWDPNGLKSDKKACHYVKGKGWELLDDPSYNSLCSCCDSSCAPGNRRDRRSLTPGQPGVAENVVFGPLRITD